MLHFLQHAQAGLAHPPASHRCWPALVTVCAAAGGGTGGVGHMEAHNVLHGHQVDFVCWQLLGGEGHKCWVGTWIQKSDWNLGSKMVLFVWTRQKKLKIISHAHTLSKIILKNFFFIKELENWKHNHHGLQSSANRSQANDSNLFVCFSYVVTTQSTVRANRLEQNNSRNNIIIPSHLPTLLYVSSVQHHLDPKFW